jgi:chorismate synthase
LVLRRLRFFTAGESHGRGLLGIIEGIPANLSLEASYIDKHLARRQKGYGRGPRMKIEQDRAIILSGVRWGMTIGSPISVLIENRDWKNWQKGMSPEPAARGSIPAVTRPRPGHADLPGVIKFNQTDVRNILERSSARETAMRVALGSVARRLLEEFGIRVGSFVLSVADVKWDINTAELDAEALMGLYEKAEDSDLRCPDNETTEGMKQRIDTAIKEGHSLGGSFVVFATGLPPGLGSHIQWDMRLDGRLAQAMLSIQAIKAVSIGEALRAAESPGSEVMDEILPGEGNLKSLRRTTNYAGGIEGGMTNGMPVVLRAFMKPIPTQRRSLRSVDISTGEAFEAAYERSDVCAVPAAAVIAEAMLSLVLADALLEKFGGDCIEECLRNYRAYVS